MMSNRQNSIYFRSVSNTIRAEQSNVSGSNTASKEMAHAGVVAISGSREVAIRDNQPQANESFAMRQRSGSDTSFHGSLKNPVELVNISRSMEQQKQPATTTLYAGDDPVRSIMLRRFETDTERRLSYHLDSSETEPDEIPATPDPCWIARVNLFDNIETKEEEEIITKMGRGEVLTYLLNMEESRLILLSNIQKDLQSLVNTVQPKQLAEANKIVEQLHAVQTQFLHKFRSVHAELDNPNFNISSIFSCLDERQNLLCSYQHLAVAIVEQISWDRRKTTYSLGEKSTNPKAMQDLRKRLQEPFNWVAETLGYIKKLCTVTPANNPDLKAFERLYEKLMTESIEHNTSIQAFGKDFLRNGRRRLLMHSLVVVLVNPQTNDRKLRYLLLFSDVLVCAKIVRKERHKGSSIMDAFRGKPPDHVSTTRNKAYYRSLRRYRDKPEDVLKIETKWMIPLENIKIQANSRLKINQQTTDEQEKRIERLKVEIMQARSKKNRMKEEGQLLRALRLDTNITKLEGQLALETPQLVLSVSEMNNTGQRHEILLVTERDRSHWRIAIEAAKQQIVGQNSAPNPTNTASFNSTMTAARRIPKPTLAEMNEILKKYQHIIRLNQTGMAVLRDTENTGKTGFLRTTIHGIQGLNDVDSYHVWIEVDSFGHFEELARTRVVCNQRNPEWNQTFDLPIDDAHTICFSLYRHCDVLAELEVNLTDSCVYDKVIAMPVKTVEERPRAIKLSFTLQLQKHPSSTIYTGPNIGKVFGHPLKELVKRGNKINKQQSAEAVACKLSDKNISKSYVPQIVIACTDEIERRGLREVGVYRICGSLNDIQRLKDLFDEDQEKGIKALPNAEIADIASLLKQFFRELPECLLTNSGSVELMNAAEIPDERVRLLVFADVIDRLHRTNRETFKYLLLHLLTIERYKEVNKMCLGNLALLWSTVLLSAPVVDNESSDMLDASGYQATYDSLNREAALSFQQTKVLHILFRAVQDGALTFSDPVFEKNVQSLKFSV